MKIAAIFLAAFVTLLAVDARAENASNFECLPISNANKALCRDATLAALQQETRRLYGLARKGSPTDRTVELEQGGFEHALQDCGEAKDKRGCRLSLHMWRIGDLRKFHASVRSSKGISRGPFTATCPTFPVPISLIFIDTTPAIAFIESRDRNAAMVQSASDRRYVGLFEGNEISFLTERNDLRLSMPGSGVLACTMAAPEK